LKRKGSPVIAPGVGWSILGLAAFRMQSERDFFSISMVIRIEYVIYDTQSCVFEYRKARTLYDGYQD
jgi:hypothetical protein